VPRSRGRPRPRLRGRARRQRHHDRACPGRRPGTPRCRPVHTGHRRSTGRSRGRGRSAPAPAGAGHALPGAGSLRRW
jgi:hypothetical protein